MQKPNKVFVLEKLRSGLRRGGEGGGLDGSRGVGTYYRLKVAAPSWTCIDYTLRKVDKLGDRERGRGEQAD